MKYFTLKELTKSDTATEKGIINIPDDVATANLIALVDNMLDPLREMYKRPIYVRSGYRCKTLNKLVGGADGSQHMKGEAADITTYNRYSNELLYHLIADYLPFDQLINEHDYAWVHVSFKANGKNRKQKLRYENGRYIADN